jgi:endonuclease-3 related protein
VDAYAKRIFERHGVISSEAKYEEVRTIVEKAIKSTSADSELAAHYNELHALLVEVGKRNCGTVAKCDGCPLQPLL